MSNGITRNDVVEAVARLIGTKPHRVQGLGEVSAGYPVEGKVGFYEVELQEAGERKTYTVLADNLEADKPAEKVDEYEGLYKKFFVFSGNEVKGAVYYASEREWAGKNPDIASVLFRFESTQEEMDIHYESYDAAGEKLAGLSGTAQIRPKADDFKAGMPQSFQDNFLTTFFDMLHSEHCFAQFIPQQQQQRVD